GFQTVIATARAAWGPDVEMLAALGHGRSYGAQSRLIVRTLPGILQSGLWRKLETLPVAPTRGLITDVGNDILYGFSAQQNPDWYGFDPIHIRAASWRPAWREILGSRVAADGNRGSTIEALRLYLMPPERQWLCGVERFSPQSGKALSSGSRVWLY